MVKSLVLDMDTQWLTIREARKNLFIYDLTDKGCNINEELWRCDELVNWSVDEPNMFPRKPVPAHQHAANQVIWMPNIAGPVAGGQGPVGAGGVMTITSAGNTQQAAINNAVNAPVPAPFIPPWPPLPAPAPAAAPQAQAPQQAPLFMAFTPSIGLTTVANTAAGAVAALGTASMAAATAALVPAAAPVAAPNPPPAVTGVTVTIAGQASTQQINVDNDDEDDYEDYDDDDGSVGDWNSERDSDAELEAFN